MSTQPVGRLWFAIALFFGAPPAVLAQGGDQEPCCSITAFDRRTGVVTALENATGRTFQFIATPAQRRTLNVGQKLWADFGTQKVSVDAASPCCAMVNVTPGTAAAAGVQRQVKPADPCCNITAVNKVTGLVTATETATGRSFQFKVADQALLRTLTAGQKVAADFGAGKVTVHGSEPCCAIVKAVQRP